MEVNLCGFKQECKKACPLLYRVNLAATLEDGIIYDDELRIRRFNRFLSQITKSWALLPETCDGPEKSEDDYRCSGVNDNFQGEEADIVLNFTSWHKDSKFVPPVIESNEFED